MKHQEDEEGDSDDDEEMAFITRKFKRFEKNKQGMRKTFGKDFNHRNFQREKITKNMKLPATNATNLDTINQNVRTLRNKLRRTRKKP